MPLSLPLLTYDFADGQYVIAAAPSHAQLLGARVVAVNGVPIQQVVERIAPIISRDNPTWIRQAAPFRWRNTSLLRALVRIPARAAHALRPVQQGERPARWRIARAVLRAPRCLPARERSRQSRPGPALEQRRQHIPQPRTLPRSGVRRRADRRQAHLARRRSLGNPALQQPADERFGRALAGRRPYDQRLWIAPQLEVEPRFTELRANRDRALEVAPPPKR